MLSHVVTRTLSGLMVAILLFPGCNRETPVYPVAGKVVFADGTPVMFGDIEFQAIDQPINARGKIQRDGSFVVGTRSGEDGAIAGKHKVVIIQIVTNHFNLDVVHDHGHMVHPRYARYETTDLTVEVKPESNELELVVEIREEE